MEIALEKYMFCDVGDTVVVFSEVKVKGSTFG